MDGQWKDELTLLAEEEPGHGEAVLSTLGTVKSLLHELRDATPVDTCDVVAETISALKRTSGLDDQSHLKQLVECRALVVVDVLTVPGHISWIVVGSEAGGFKQVGALRQLDVGAILPHLVWPITPRLLPGLTWAHTLVQPCRLSPGSARHHSVQDSHSASPHPPGPSNWSKAR